jgi:uncharacterized radical SAM superfamily Fe-S cluster-containing enzyme
MNTSVLADTESVCPVCLRTLPAQRVLEGDDIHLVKHCPEHGRFNTVVWRGHASYLRWQARGSRAATPPVTQTAVRHGCPHDCGLCPDHRQHSCCVLLEVTPRCNLRCPVCFAGSGAQGADPTLADIDSWLDRLRAHGSPVNIQLSGGEPTLRDDLPEIVRRTRARGFDFVQVNTNGIRLAKEAGYAQALAGPGWTALSCSSTASATPPTSTSAAPACWPPSCRPSNTAPRPAWPWCWCPRWCRV